MNKYKIIIVGGGAAGIGNAIALKHLGLDEKDYVVLEKGQVASSFKKWPVEMKFITPSFTGNQFGAVDLNAISTHTSPAYTLSKEHVTGKEYAEYLQGIVAHYEIPVKTDVEVLSINKENDEFEIETSDGKYISEFLIWCGGEFQFPNLNPFKGAEYCKHNTHIDSYKNIEGKEQVLIGGYESGIDAAVNFSQLNKEVVVFDSGSPWSESSSDPSTVLSTYTFERLQDELPKGNIELVANFKVTEVKKISEGYEIFNQRKEKVFVPNQPILCNGFSGSTKLIGNLFEENENGDIALTEIDESTITKNLFLSGPMVRQDKAIFCFIYKFRQRFPVIAQAIAKRLNISSDGLDIYKKANMFLEDLSCCEDECAC